MKMAYIYNCFCRQYPFRSSLIAGNLYSFDDKEKVWSWNRQGQPLKLNERCIKEVSNNGPSGSVSYPKMSINRLEKAFNHLIFKNHSWLDLDGIYPRLCEHIPKRHSNQFVMLKLMKFNLSSLNFVRDVGTNLTTFSFKVTGPLTNLGAPSTNLTACSLKVASLDI